MKIQLEASGFELTQGTHAGVRERLRRLEKIVPMDTVYHVRLTKDKNYICEIQVQMGKQFTRSEAKGRDLKQVINKAVKVLRKRILKNKKKEQDREQNTYISVDEVVKRVENQVEKDYAIHSVQRVILPIMTKYEAIYELESNPALGFILFRNLEGWVSVIQYDHKGFKIIEVE